MHCPRCGQEQVSGNLKFCSRCGLPMTLVAEIVSRGGHLPRLAQESGGGFFTRSNGLKVSLVWFLVIDFLLVPLIAIAGGEEITAVLAIVGFVGALILAVLSALFLRNPAVRPDFVEMPADFSLGAPGIRGDQSVLSAGEQPTAAEFVSQPGSWKAADTGDLVIPGTVTEETTKLLKKEE